MLLRSPLYFRHRPKCSYACMTTCADTFCGILYRVNYIGLYILYIKHASPPLCFLQRPLSCLWGSRSVGATNIDPLAVIVLPGLFVRLSWLGWGIRYAR